MTTQSNATHLKRVEFKHRGGYWEIYDGFWNSCLRSPTKVVAARLRQYGFPNVAEQVSSGRYSEGAEFHVDISFDKSFNPRELNYLTWLSNTKF